MHNPPRTMTMEVLAEALSQFSWPAPYTLEDWRPDGIAVVFPKCTLLFEEGFESDMELRFSSEDTGIDSGPTLKQVLVALGGVRGSPGLVDKHIPQASLEKVKIGIHNLCTIVLTHFATTPLGDFAWIERYIEACARKS